MKIETIFKKVNKEIYYARNKFPSNKHLLAAFNEESGEVTKAMMDYHQGKGTKKNIIKESIQAIAMAVRLIQEGDPDFKYHL